MITNPYAYITVRRPHPTASSLRLLFQSLFHLPDDVVLLALPLHEFLVPDGLPPRHTRVLLHPPVLARDASAKLQLHLQGLLLDELPALLGQVAQTVGCRDGLDDSPLLEAVGDVLGADDGSQVPDRADDFAEQKGDEEVTGAGLSHGVHQGLRQAEVVVQPLQDGDHIEARVGDEEGRPEPHHVRRAVKADQDFAVIFVGLVESRHESLFLGFVEVFWGFVKILCW